MFKVRQANTPVVLADLIYLVDENPEKFTHIEKPQLLNMLVDMLYKDPSFLMYVIYSREDDLVGYAICQVDMVFNHELFVYDVYVCKPYRKTRALNYVGDICIQIAIDNKLECISAISRRLPKEFWEEHYTFGGKLKTKEIISLNIDNKFKHTYQKVRQEILQEVS